MRVEARPIHLHMGLRNRRTTTAVLLAAATVGVYATEWLAFMWPVMALIDAAVAAQWRRRMRAR
jgi:hypothetical protein